MASSIEEKALAVVLVDGRLEEETRACNFVVGILLHAGVFCDANARGFQEDIMMKCLARNWIRPRMKRYRQEDWKLKGRDSQDLLLLVDVFD